MQAAVSHAHNALREEATLRVTCRSISSSGRNLGPRLCFGSMPLAATSAATTEKSRAAFFSEI